MAVKRTVHERCPSCGQLAARLNNDGSVSILGHRCNVPGPQNPPKRYRVGEVLFEADCEEVKRRSERMGDHLWLIALIRLAIVVAVIAAVAAGAWVLWRMLA